MLFPPKELAEEVAALMKDPQRPDLISQVRRIVERFPEYGPTWLFLGSLLEDPAEQEAAYWKALCNSPSNPAVYLGFASELTKKDQNDPIGKRLSNLAIWKLALADEIPDVYARHFKPVLEDDSREPEAYEMLAAAGEEQLRAEPEHAQAEAKLRPYYLLNELQKEAPDDLEEETLDAILDDAKDCEPVLRGALREWARDEKSLHPKSLYLLIAILGEIAGPEVVDEFMELACWDDRIGFLHLHWALYRLAERYPAAVLDQFKTLAKGAVIDRRCAIADHISLMEPVPGDIDLLVSLVDGLEAQKSNPSAAYLLACVVHTLIQRGQREKAKALGKMQSLFGGPAREIVRNALRDLGDFLPDLQSEGMVGLEIGDVCLERSLMDDERDEDESDWDEDDLDEDDVDEEEFDEEAALPGPELTGRLVSQVADFAVDWHKDKGMRRATNLYFGDDGKKELTEDDFDGFMQWIVHDHREPSTQRTAVEQFLRVRESQLSTAEREQLEAMRDARFGLYEVERVEPGKGVELRNVFEPGTIFVHDISSSNSMHRWDCLLSRTQFESGRCVFSGNGLLVPRDLLDHLRDWIIKESRLVKKTQADFVRANSHRMHREVKRMMAERLRNLKVVNNEGEEVAFGEAEYEVTDQTALLAKLRSLDELTEHPGEQPAFTWLQPIGEEKRPLGELHFEGRRLVAEAMSRTRLQTLRGLIEFHGGSLVKHTGEHYTTTDEIKERVLRGEKAPRTAEDTPEAREVVAQVLAQHYAGWPDEKLPALGGKTARQAVRTKNGRKAVVEMLRTFQNSESRKAKRGEPAYDFNILRRELGLPEE